MSLTKASSQAPVPWCLWASDWVWASPRGQCDLAAGHFCLLQGQWFGKCPQVACQAVGGWGRAGLGAICTHHRGLSTHRVDTPLGSGRMQKIFSCCFYHSFLKLLLMVPGLSS